jgi:hypothetical protein
VTITHYFSFICAVFIAATLQLPQSLFSVRLDVLTTRATNYPDSPLVVVSVNGEAEEVVVVAAYHLVLVA